MQVHNETRNFQIHRIPLRLSNAYLLQKDDVALLVDAGIPGETERIMSHLQRRGVKRLEFIFLTHAHYDHVGSAAELRRQSGARILIQEADMGPLRRGETHMGEVRGRGRLSAWLLPLIERILPVDPVEPDLVFNDTFEIPDLGVQALAMHVPGHTLGSSVLLVERFELFAGDLVSSTGGPHPQRYYAQDWDAIQHSLSMIQKLQPTRTYPGHGHDWIELKDLLDLTI